MPNPRVARLLLLACMVWGLVLAPFAHALSMAAAAADAQQERVSHCHQADGDKAPVSGCCCHKGTVCHCAVTAALPNSLFPSFTMIPLTYAVAVESFQRHNLPPPEPPPPRQA